MKLENLMANQRRDKILELFRKVVDSGIQRLENQPQAGGQPLQSSFQAPTSIPVFLFAGNFGIGVYHRTAFGQLVAEKHQGSAVQ